MRPPAGQGGRSPERRVLRKSKAEVEKASSENKTDAVKASSSSRKDKTEARSSKGEAVKTTPSSARKDEADNDSGAKVPPLKLTSAKRTEKDTLETESKRMKTEEEEEEDDDDMSDFIAEDSEDEEDDEEVDYEEDEDDDEEDEDEEDGEDNDASLDSEKEAETAIEDDKVDVSNIISGKRTRRPPQRYEHGLLFKGISQDDVVQRSRRGDACRARG